MVEYLQNDIVRLKEAKFEEYKGQLWFKDNVFAISEKKKDGQVLLKELDEPVLSNELLPMPINKNHAGNIYYDPIVAASFIGPDDEIPVHSTDYTYFMDAFKKVTEEDGTTLYDLVEKEGFKYVHEVQHLLRNIYGTDDLRIHHKLVTPTEMCFRNLWNLRKDLLGAGVSSYQFLYEMANMLYLRWMAVSDDNIMPRWKNLERAKGNELLEKYQKGILQIKQQTRIYSAKVLEQAISEVSNCAKLENIAKVFDLILEENNRTKASGAAQNYMPMVISQLLVELMQPQPGERWHDPASGFSGILVEIDNYLRKNTGNYQLLTQEEKVFQLTEALSGMEIHKEAARIGFCNTRFHGLRCEIKVGDSLTVTNNQLYDGIICEPPIQMFSLAGKQGTGNFNNNRQLDYIEYILKSLSSQSNSRAAILLPESFLNKASSDYRNIRKRLFEDYNLHTILRIPKGLNANSNISMCALFLTQGHNRDNRVLIYDMQSEIVKTEQQQEVKFNGFIKAFRGRILDKRSSILTLEELRNENYKVSFRKGKQEYELQLDSPSAYLMEANKTVRDIRSLLVKIEKEING